MDVNQCPAQPVSPVILHYVIACDQIKLIELVKLATRIKVHGLLLHFTPSKLRRISSMLNSMLKKTQDSILIK